MMRRADITICLMLISTVGFSQTVVSSEAEYEQEALQSRSEVEQDLAEREELLEHLARHPIAVNFADQQELAQIPWLNDLQIRNLLIYRRAHGLILSQYELQLIEGFDRETIESILPYLDFTRDRVKRKMTCPALWKEGQNDLLIRTSGFNKPKDSLYWGSAAKVLIKYRYDWQNRLNAGFLLDKDAGEAMFSKPLDRPPYFDHSSAFVMFSRAGPFSRIVLGDYHLRVGQGLALWGGYNIGRTIFASGYSRRAGGIVQNSSAVESGYMRGAAATVTSKHLTFTGFYSIAPVDARRDSLKRIASLVTDGYHRDSAEWSRRRNERLTAFGGRVAWKTGSSELGLNVVEGSYSEPFAPSNKLYKRYDLVGPQFGNLSFDHRLLLGKIMLSGELARSQTAQWAVIQNILIQPAYGYSFFVSLRSYGVGYRAPFGNCLGESGFPQNENGLFFAASMLVSSKVTVRTFVDFYRYPWLKYRIDAPSRGLEHQVQLEWNVAPPVLITVRISNKNRPLNLPADSNPLNQIEIQHRLNFRVNAKVTVGKQVTLQSRVEWNRLKKTAGESEGHLLLQDVGWRDRQDRISLTVRLAWFKASYDNRFYTYENDHRFSFSTPMLYGDGIRWYLFGRMKFLKRHILSAKLGYLQKQAPNNSSAASSDLPETAVGSPTAVRNFESSLQLILKL